jgi:metallo-beta-lactamase class B
MINHLKPFIICFFIFGCTSAKITESNKAQKSESLVIQKIGTHVYQHISFLNAGRFGKVTCNGMIVFSKGEAIIFDTPTDSDASLELINWVENKLHCKIKAIIPTHFHSDCLGGLPAFHQHGIASYANNLTIKLAKLNNKTVPENGFDHLLELQVGNKTVIAEYLGKGHTQDNIIGYFPDEKIVFGGCLIKESGAGKGNLEDANIQDWSLTVEKVKEKYPDTKIVIPGHGKSGGTELFDYTIHLFNQKK